MEKKKKNTKWNTKPNQTKHQKNSKKPPKPLKTPKTLPPPPNTTIFLWGERVNRLLIKNELEGWAQGLGAWVSTIWYFKNQSAKTTLNAMNKNAGHLSSKGASNHWTTWLRPFSPYWDTGPQSHNQIGNPMSCVELVRRASTWHTTRQNWTSLVSFFQRVLCSPSQ